jgi:hypothetical protein
VISDGGVHLDSNATGFGVIATTCVTFADRPRQAFIARVTSNDGVTGLVVGDVARDHAAIFPLVASSPWQSQQLEGAGPR